MAPMKTDEDRVRDHHSLWQAEDRDHGLGASVMEAPSVAKSVALYAPRVRNQL